MLVLLLLWIAAAAAGWAAAKFAFLLAGLARSSVHAYMYCTPMKRSSMVSGKFSTVLEASLLLYCSAWESSDGMVTPSDLSCESRVPPDGSVDSTKNLQLFSRAYA